MYMGITDIAQVHYGPQIKGKASINHSPTIHHSTLSFRPIPVTTYPRSTKMPPPSSTAQHCASRALRCATAWDHHTPMVFVALTVNDPKKGRLLQHFPVHCPYWPRPGISPHPSPRESVRKEPIHTHTHTWTLTHPTHFNAYDGSSMYLRNVGKTTQVHTT
jgi:hypothetical protein